MSGVYGDFIECFPELHETFAFWNKPDKSDLHKVRGVYIPTKGGGIKRRKYTSGNTALDLQEGDAIYVSLRYKICEGEYFSRENDPYTYRIVADVPYDKAAGYRTYAVERVTGTTPDKDEKLEVKEASFA